MLTAVLSNLLTKLSWTLMAWLGSPRYQYSLARAYQTARFGKQDERRAVFWCRRAAGQCYGQAESLLASFYVAEFGVGEDLDQVFYWYKRAAEHGDPTGQSSLAWCYQQGVGTGIDPGLAFKWWIEAARRGLPEAQFAVADCLHRGFGTAKDRRMAEDWCRLAARNGHGEAQELLRVIQAESDSEIGARAPT